MRHAIQGRSRARRARLFILLAVASLAIPSQGAGGRGGLTLPDGFRVFAARTVAPGVVHFRVRSADQRINIARIEPGAARPLVAVAHRGTEHGTQRTSTMCARRDCLLGVNGDFFYSRGRPAGAVVVRGEPWITRRYQRPHLLVGRDGSFRTSRVDIPMKLRIRYPHALEPLDDLVGSDAFEGERGSIRVHGVNTTRREDQLVAYTARRGARTRTSRKGIDVVARFTSEPERLRLRSTSSIRLTDLRPRGNARIPRSGIVLSGRGDSARRLRRLWNDVRDGTARRTVRLEIGGPKRADQVIGGRPVLVRDGEVMPQRNDWFSYAPNARTVAGWDEAGALYLVTIDASGYARGMSLERAARFLKTLGLVGAINLDGGGSSTFVRRGHVRNHPKYGSERSVGSSLVIVRS